MEHVRLSIIGSVKSSFRYNNAISKKFEENICLINLKKISCIITKIF